MNKMLLETSQMLSEHPIISENISLKIRYINILDYFVRKYSRDDKWANSMLKLYIKKLLGNDRKYTYDNFDFQKHSKEVMANKFKPFKFFTYRYCLLFDCIFINAYENKEKGEKIFTELQEINRKRYRKKLQRVFNFLYNYTTSVDYIDNINYMKDCWNKNKEFLKTEPIKVIITANMSAGKSTLMNAFVGKKINKTQNDSCTAKTHYILNKAFEDNLSYELDYLLELDADYNTLMEDNEENKDNKIMVGTCFRTINPINKRIWFIDTPGVNSYQDYKHKEITINTIKYTDADLLIYLLNGENIGTDDDKKHLLYIKKSFNGNILFVINKVDRFKNKEDSVSETIKTVIEDLKSIGFVEPNVVPVSSYAGYLAKMSIFKEELDEDEQDEFDRMSRKLKKEEYQFNTYYPKDIQDSVHTDESSENFQLLIHSGILHLENIIYNVR
ncbi:dynamin family protein [Peptoanaerobacter stomatis]|uniref:dynamin family protein n=1 Tax=Peptoanaerobacter stomatis TaxID=796937 RepID=UPI003FA07538